MAFAFFWLPLGFLEPVALPISLWRQYSSSHRVPIHSFVDSSTPSMPASTSGSTHLSLFQYDKCWCKLAVCRLPQLSNVNTSALNPDGRRKEILTEIRLPHMEKPYTSAQLTNVNCTVVVNFDKTSWSVHDSFSASYMLACDDVWVGLSQSVHWFAKSLSALNKWSHNPNGAACALHTFVSLALVPSCTTSILLGALHSYWPPHTAHHQQQCFFFLLMSSPCPVETHQTLSFKVKLLHCGQTKHTMKWQLPFHRLVRWPVAKYPCFFFSIFYTMSKRPISYYATFSYTSRMLSRVHHEDFSIHHEWNFLGQRWVFLVSTYLIWFVPNWFYSTTKLTRLCGSGTLSHHWTSSFNNHLDHCLVVFNHIQQNVLKE